MKKIYFLLLLFLVQWNESLAMPEWSYYGDLLEPRCYFQALAIDDSTILVMGGVRFVNSNINEVLNTCEFINLKAGSRTIAPPMNYTRSEFIALHTKDSNVVVIGGMDNGRNGVSIVEMFDRKAKTWRVIGGLMHPCQQPAATFINDSEILVVGGRASYNSNGTNSCEIFNINTKLSKRIADYPHNATQGVTLTSSDGSVWAFGFREGASNSFRTSSVYRYDMANDRWIVQTYMRDVVQNERAIKDHLGRIIVVNGGFKDYQLKLSNQIMIEENNTFKLLGNSIIPRVKHGLAFLSQDTLLVIGGFDEGSIALRETEIIDINTGSVSMGPALIHGRSMPEIVPVKLNGKLNIFAIGGCSSGYSNSLSSIEVLAELEADVIDVSDIIQNCGTAVVKFSSDFDINQILLDQNWDNVRIVSVSPTPNKEVTITLTLVDPSRDGHFTISVVNKKLTVAKTTGSISHVGTQLSLISPLESDGFVDLGKIGMNYKSVYKLKLKNVSTNVLVIDSTYMFSNIEFSIPKNILPITVAPGDTIELPIVICPRMLGLVRDSLMIFDDCFGLMVRLKGEGISNDYAAGTKCDAVVVGSTVKYKHYPNNPTPNPSRGLFRLFISQAELDNITVTDINGCPVEFGLRELSRTDLDGSDLVEIEFDLRNQESGAYIIGVGGGSIVFIEK